MTTSTGPPEVSFGHESGRLAIVIRWFHPSQWFWYPRVLLLLALDLLLVVGVRYALVVAESWALLVPLGMFVGLPAAALQVDVVRSLRNRTTITVDETRLRAITGPMAPAGADVPLAGVAGWRITDMRSRSDLLAVGAVSTIVFVAEDDILAIEPDQATVRYGDAVSVAREIGEHRFGSGEGRLGVDHPALLAHW